MSDLPDESFLRLLDLSRPALAPVQAALGRGDLPAASAAYLAHFRRKALSGPLITDWAAVPRDPKHDPSAADGLLAGHFWDGYSVYEVPPAGIDWHGSPLSCVTRFPIFGVLREAIHHTRDPRYVRFVVDHILDYMAAYPMEQFAGRSTREGWIDHFHVAKPWYWCMIPNRLPELAQTVALIRQFPDVRDGELLRILRRIHEETAYLRTEIQSWVDARHNGGCAMIQALAQAGAILEDFSPAGEWLAGAAELTVQYLDQAFYPDGMCVELTTAYGASVADITQRLAYALRGQQAIQASKGKLDALITCLVGLSDPTGWLPSFGDLYARTLSDYLSQPLADWLGLRWAKARAQGTAEPKPPFTLWPVPGQKQWCGYYTMRSDWSPDANYLAIDAGPWGTTHQHGDKLSFVVTSHGAKFIIDPSSTRYASNEPGAFIGGQPSGFLHNTITVDGVDEFHSEGSVAETKEPLRNTWRQGSGYALFAGGYTFAPVKPVRWERRVLFVDGAYWLLQDVLTGELDRAAIEQNFQFEADVEIEFDGHVTVAKAPGGARLVLRPLEGSLQPQLTVGDRHPHLTYWSTGQATEVLRSEDGHDQKHGRGWTGRGGDRLLPAPAVTYVGNAAFPVVLTVALIPVPPRGDPADLPMVERRIENGATTWNLPARDRPVRFVTTTERCEVK